MSAAEHEAVEVDVNPSDFVDEQDAGAAAGSGGSSSARPHSSIIEMLQSTEPAESPEMQDGTLSTAAEWHQHAELAFKKITGSSGTPAWLNLAMAAILAMVQQHDPAAASSKESDTNTDTDIEIIGE